MPRTSHPVLVGPIAAVAVLVAVLAMPGCTAMIAKGKGGYMDLRPPAPMYFGEWVGIVDADGLHDPGTPGTPGPADRIVRIRFGRDGAVEAATFAAERVARASLDAPVGAIDRAGAQSEHKGAWRYDERPDWPWHVEVGPWKRWIVEPRRSWTAGLWFIDPRASNQSKAMTLVPPAEFFVGRWLGFDFTSGRALELHLDGSGSASLWWYDIEGTDAAEPKLALDEHIEARWRLEPTERGLWVIDLGQIEPIMLMLNTDHAEERGFGLRLSVPSHAFKDDATSFTMRLVRPGAKGWLAQ